jgi:hypothetical protein
MPEIQDTWSTRALPFLTSAVARFEAYGEANSAEIAIDTRIAEHRVLLDTAKRLQDEGFLEFYFEGGGNFYVTGVTERGLRTVGAWPTPESLVDRLLAALAEREANAATEEERGRIRKTIDALASVGREVLTNAAGSALGGALG